jgi:hypothetical protein
MTDRGSGARLAPIASLMEISRILEETARIVRDHALAERQPDAAAAPVAPVSDAAIVRSIIDARRLRRERLGAAMAREPAWGMVLELYLARLEGRRVYQTMVGLGAGVPETTAFNLTSKLLARGTFTREHDPDDRRLAVIGLSNEAADKVRRYLEAALELSPLVA